MKNPLPLVLLLAVGCQAPRVARDMFEVPHEPTPGRIEIEVDAGPRPKIIVRELDDLPLLEAAYIHIFHDLDGDGEPSEGDETVYEARCSSDPETTFFRVHGARLRSTREERPARVHAKITTVSGEFTRSMDL